MKDRELLAQALETLEDIFGKNKVDVGIITALRERLAQPEQEHVIDCPRCGHCCPQRQEQERVLTATYTCGVCGVSMQMEQPQIVGYVPAGYTSQERVDEEAKQRQEQKPVAWIYRGSKVKEKT